MMEKMVDREVAWRIFAHEFNRSNLYISEGEERAPNYVVTPTGVKCNRLFIVGVVTEVENIRADNNLWRARIADPTGVFTVYAGQYQPEAAIFLSELDVPAYVAVVGKARTYEPEEGSVYTSVRPEEINYGDEKLRDRWVIDTAERTLERIKIIDDALKSKLSGDGLKEYLIKKGTNAVLADGAVRAMNHYKNMDKMISDLKAAVIRAVETVALDTVKKDIPEPIETKADEHPAEKLEVMEKTLEGEEIASESVKEPPAEKKPKEMIADIIDRMDTGKGIAFSAVIENAVNAGIDPGAVESGIKELMDEGRCYEPRIGVLRKV